MGLDMYLYKIKKPDIPKNEIITKEWLEEKGYQYFLKDDIENGLCSEIKPYTEPCKINLEFINIEKIAQDNNVELKTWYTGIITPDFRVFNFSSDGVEKEVVVTNQKIMDEYLYIETNTVYVCMQEEIYYWRKAYDMQKFIYKMFDNKIENLEYKRITMDQLNKIHDFEQKKLSKEGYLTGNFEIERIKENSAYFYHEWY